MAATDKPSSPMKVSSPWRKKSSWGENTPLFSTQAEEDEVTYGTYATTIQGRVGSDYYGRVARAPDHRGWPTWYILTRFRGTALSHALMPASISFFFALFFVQMNIWFPETWSEVRMNPTGQTILIVPIAFLLVVRTDLSYERFWEARQRLADIVVSSRQLVSKCAYYVKGNSVEARETRSRICQYTLAFFITVRHNLAARSQGMTVKAEQSHDYAGYLTAQELDYLKGVIKNKPVVIQHWIRCLLCDAHKMGLISSNESLHIILEEIECMLHAWADCFRISNTPMPFPYQHLLQFLLYFWVLSIPCALIGNIGNPYVIPPIAVITSITLFGINGVGQEIEDPFGDDFNDINMEEFEIIIAEDVEVLNLERGVGHISVDRVVQDLD